MCLDVWFFLNNVSSVKVSSLYDILTSVIVSKNFLVPYYYVTGRYHLVVKRGSRRSREPPDITWELNP